MDYLECESRCLHALSVARREDNWAYYGRVLMPLQECRRQRRMIAAEGTVRLGTGDLADPVAAWFERCKAGCLVVTRPHDELAAMTIASTARQRMRYVEVLFADNEVQAPTWTLRSFPDGGVSCRMPAPPRDWINRWLQGSPAADSPGDASNNLPWPTPADWFIDATETLGDAALAGIDDAAAGHDRLIALERCLDAVTDHEIIHQRLGDAARALCLARD
jgi:hypothetical protein